MSCARSAARTASRQAARGEAAAAARRSCEDCADAGRADADANTVPTTIAQHHSVPRAGRLPAPAVHIFVPLHRAPRGNAHGHAASRRRRGGTGVPFAVVMERLASTIASSCKEIRQRRSVSHCRHDSVVARSMRVRAQVAAHRICDAIASSSLTRTSHAHDARGAHARIRRVTACAASRMAPSSSFILRCADERAREHASDAGHQSERIVRSNAVRDVPGRAAAMIASLPVANGPDAGPHSVATGMTPAACSAVTRPRTRPGGKRARHAITTAAGACGGATVRHPPSFVSDGDHGAAARQQPGMIHRCPIR